MFSVGFCHLFCVGPVWVMVIPISVEVLPVEICTAGLPAPEELFLLCSAEGWRLGPLPLALGPQGPGASDSLGFGLDQNQVWPREIKIVASNIFKALTFCIQSSRT